MNKYIITFLSTSLFLSLMIHIHNNEYIDYLKKDNMISTRIIELNSDRILQLENSSVE